MWKLEGYADEVDRWSRCFVCGIPAIGGAYFELSKGCDINEAIRWYSASFNVKRSMGFERFGHSTGDSANLMVWYCSEHLVHAQLVGKS